jgi:L-threonylcarbamoyladenylate synthase
VARLLARRFRPGGLTLVVPRSPALPSLISAGGANIGVRIPDHPVALALIRGLGRAIVGTSANLSGQPSPVTAQEVYQQLGDRIDLIIDGGRCPGGRESTVVDCTAQPPRVLREGIIARAEVEKAIREGS